MVHSSISIKLFVCLSLCLLAYNYDCDKRLQIFRVALGHPQGLFRHKKFERHGY